MDFDDEYEDDSFVSFSDDHLPDDQDRGESDLYPFNLRDPEMAYLFLSDDAQDKLRNPQNRRLCSNGGRTSDYKFICHAKLV